MEVSTKATEVTSSNLGTFNVIAASGAAGSQSQVWSTTASKVGATDVWATDKYWPSTDQGYTSFYASNAALTFNAAGPTVSPADNSVDVVVAHCASPTYHEQNSLTFNHVFARVGSITLNTQSGYSLSNVSATLQSPVTGGTYNLRTQVWIPGAASANQAMGAFSGSATAQTSSNDYWLVPGDYTLSVSYTLTKGDYQESFTKTGTVTLVQGKTNAITATALGGSATEIKFGVYVISWSTNAIVLDLSNAVNSHPFSVSSTKTVNFANSNLLYDGTRPEGHRWCLMENPWDVIETNGNVTLSESSKISLFGWGTSGYNGKNPWMQSTNASSYGNGDTDIAGTNYDWGIYNDIYSYGDVLLGSAGTFRTLTKDEWKYVCGSSGSRAGKEPALAVVNGVRGLLMFSDDYSYPAGLIAINRDRSGYTDNTFTQSQFEQMCSAGAVFFPASGGRQSKSVYSVRSDGFYWSASQNGTNAAFFLLFNYNSVVLDSSNSRLCGFTVRLVRE